MREGEMAAGVVSELREYQRTAVAAVRAHWKRGVRCVCLVAPTGAGKTRLGEELVDGDQAVVWIAHRRELIHQAADRLRARFGTRSVGLIMPGEYRTPKARIQVATVQTLLAIPDWKVPHTLVLDEAHHYAAAEWRRIAERCPNARTLGLTATPERRDGEPLGDLFEAMVVASSYSALVRDGFLVPARVYRPEKNLGNDLAQDPLDAWVKYSEGSRAFVFCARVEIAVALAKRCRDAGVNAATIEADTPKRERDDILASFRRGTVRILTNVNTLTEGVDVPEARTVILARAFGHVGSFLQAAGRALRPAKGKPDAILIDLTGSTLKHGLPTDDRIYSLEGRAISGGMEQVHGERAAPEFSQEVKGVDLRCVSTGASKGVPMPVETVMAAPIDDTERRNEYQQLLSLARKHRLSDGFAAARYKEKYGEWPGKAWAQ